MERWALAKEVFLKNSEATPCQPGGSMPPAKLPGCLLAIIKTPSINALFAYIRGAVRMKLI
jgi:hypothetical protein